MIAIIAIAALLLASPTLLPQLEMALSSARSNGGKDVALSLYLFVPDIDETVIRIVRSFDPNMLGTYGTYTGDYFQNEWYVSLFAIPLIIYQIFSPNKKDRTIFYQFLILILIASIPLVSFLMNATKTINYRWMYAIHLFLCTASCIALTRMTSQGLEKKATIKTVITSATIVVLFIMYYCWHTSGITNLDRFKYTILSTIIVSAILVAVIYNYEKITDKIHIETRYDKKKVACCILIVIMMVSTTAIYYPWLNNHTSHNFQGTYGYDDGDERTISHLSNEDQTFFRVYKDYDSVYDGSGIPSDNDSMAQSYYGLKNYNSMNNPNYIHFLQELGVYVACLPDIESLREQGITPDSFTGAQLNYINGIDDNYDLLNYLGVKYYLSRSDSENKIPEQFVYKYSENGTDVYENTKCYPLAFVNTNYIRYDDFIKENYQTRTELILKNTIINETITANNTSIPSTVEVTSFTESKIILNANIKNGPQIVSLSMPFDKHWDAYIDGEKTKTQMVNIALLGILVDEGDHTIELKYNNYMFKLGMYLAAFTLIVVIATTATRILVIRNKDEN